MGGHETPSLLFEKLLNVSRHGLLVRAVTLSTTVNGGTPIASPHGEKSPRLAVAELFLESHSPVIDG